MCVKLKLYNNRKTDQKNVEGFNGVFTLPDTENNTDTDKKNGLLRIG